MSRFGYTLALAALGMALSGPPVPAQQSAIPTAPRRTAPAPATVPAPSAPDRGWLGVSLDGIRPAPPRREDVPDEAPPPGVRLGAVIRNSPADRAGLHGGDLVTAIDGQPVESTQEFIQAISSRGPGAWVDLEVSRRGTERRVTVRLERFPDDAARLRDVKLGWAGLEALDVPLQLREQWGGSEERGVLVGAVAELGPAERGGVRPGDLVLEIDGEPVAAASDLAMRIARVGDGAKVELALSRQGLALTVEVLLEVEPPEEAANNPPHRNPAEGPQRRPNGR